MKHLMLTFAVVSIAAVALAGCCKENCPFTKKDTHKMEHPSPDHPN